jgi:transcription elongation factor GreB
MMSLSPTKVYLTKEGFMKLQSEFKHLKSKERPEVVNVVSWAAGNGDRSENGDYQYGKLRLKEIDKRLAFLAKRLANCEVIDPSLVNSKLVGFSATVTIIDEFDKKSRYQIVGPDESDPTGGKINWQSPLGKALINKSEGEWITYNSPQGTKDIQILKIEYLPQIGSS